MAKKPKNTELALQRISNLIEAFFVVKGAISGVLNAPLPSGGQLDPNDDDARWLKNVLESCEDDIADLKEQYDELRGGK